MSAAIRNKLDKFVAHLRRDDVRSLYIVLASVLVSALGSTIIITGVWPYLQVVQP